jgi:hypothetical protein
MSDANERQSASKPENEAVDPAPAEIDPAAIMEEVRERVRMESLVDRETKADGDTVAVGELRELAREIRELRDRLSRELGESKKLLRLTATLDHSAFENLEEARETAPLPPSRRIEKIAPLHLLFKVYRKGMLKSQRLFNKAAVSLFRGVFRNFLLLEKQQLSILKEFQRLDEFDQRLARLERQIEILSRKD